MQIVFGFLGIVLAVILLPIVLKAQSPQSSAPTNPASTDISNGSPEAPGAGSSPTPLVRVIPLAELKQRLQALDEEAEAKAKLAPPPMAMCYSIAPPRPDKSIPYLCPVCKTEGTMPERQKYELEAMRKQVALLKDFSGKLDESFLCAPCSKARPGQSRSYLLELSIADLPAPRRIPVTQADLYLLTRFLTQPNFTIDTTGPEAAQIAERIHRLLGISKP